MRKLTVALLVLAACGGVAGDTLLVDLTDEDKESVCQDEIDAFVEETFTCEGVDLDMDGEDDEFTTEVATLSDCTAGFDVAAECGATLDDWYDCSDAMIDGFCDIMADGTMPAACDWMGDCYTAE